MTTYMYGISRSCKTEPVPECKGGKIKCRELITQVMEAEQRMLRPLKDQQEQRVITTPSQRDTGSIWCDQSPGTRAIHWK